MTEKIFTIPFSFAERRPIILEKLFYIPKFYDHYDEFIFPAFSKIFQNSNPCVIEYCSGNGEWIVKKALENPDKNWIAVEMRFDRAKKIWLRMHAKQLQNLFIVLGEGFTFTKYFISQNSLHEVYINFPDPWPKNRHVKHRLIRKEFIDELSRILISNGRTIIVSDDEPFAQRAIQFFIVQKPWKSSFMEPYFQTQWEGYGSSFFETLWKSKGCTIYYMQFENCK